MKVPMSWIEEYLDIELEPSDIAEKLTMAGVEVGHIERVGENWDEELLLVGQIIDIIPHPNADRLSLPTVDIGGGREIQVVCGAPNITVGQKIAFAREGAELFNPRTEKTEVLKPTKIRGVESSGMVCSSLELGMGTDHEGILELDQEYPVGSSLAKAFGETIFHTELTPNRPDCLSILGMAYEIAALTGQTVRTGSLHYETEQTPISNAINVSVEDPSLCARYTGTIIRDVTIGKSPEWLRNRLENSGVRSINNAVDITNYVMLEYGQPLHAFDVDKINGHEIIVRRARSGETLVSLDGVLRKLQETMLIIADSEKPVGLAGIIGGQNTEIDESTMNIFLESANFSPSNTRRTRTDLGLNTEASYRFERNLRPELSEPALRRATQLFLELCGGKALSGIIDKYPGKSEVSPVRLTTARLAKILGGNFQLEKDVWPVLESLGFQRAKGPTSMVDLIEALEGSASRERGQSLWVTPPIWRSDIHIEDDLVEEFARVYGYDNLPVSGLSSSVPTRISDPSRGLRESLRDRLVSAGMDEVITYTTCTLNALKVVGSIVENSDAIHLANPMDSTKGSLRTSLLPNVLETLSRNSRHQADAPLKLFEVGHVFRPSSEPSQSLLPSETEEIVGVILGRRNHDSIWATDHDSIDFFDLKGIVEHAADGVFGETSYQPSEHTAFSQSQTATILKNGSPIGTLGEIDSPVASYFNMQGRNIYAFVLNFTDIIKLGKKEETRFIPLNRYPSSTRDLALLCRIDIPAANITKIIQDHLLVSNAYPIDTFIGEDMPKNMKSITYRVTFQSSSKTLETSELEKAQQQIYKNLARRLDIEERFSAET